MHMKTAGHAGRAFSKQVRRADHSREKPLQQGGFLLNATSRALIIVGTLKNFIG